MDRRRTHCTRSQSAQDTVEDHSTSRAHSRANVHKPDEGKQPSPSSLTKEQEKLLDLLAEAGAEKLVASLRRQGSTKSGQEECECGEVAPPGTVVGLTGLAALLIYVLSIQTIGSSKGSGSGRAIKPNSYGHMETLLSALVTEHLSETARWSVARPEPMFPGFTWAEYRAGKLLAPPTTAAPVPGLRSGAARRVDTVTGQKRKRLRPVTKDGLLARVERWLRGRGRLVYRPVNGTKPSPPDCECSLRHLLDVLGYVPLAVLLGYSTTLSTTALATAGAGGGTAIDVTINDADTITNSNNNAPTLTNTDSDVITNTAQGNPINTNTNTASNQDSDMITNMAGGRALTYRRRKSRRRSRASRLLNSVTAVVLLPREMGPPADRPQPRLTTLWDVMTAGEHRGAVSRPPVPPPSVQPPPRERPAVQRAGGYRPTSPPSVCYCTDTKVASVAAAGVSALFSLAVFVAARAALSGSQLGLGGLTLEVRRAQRRSLSDPPNAGELRPSRLRLEQLGRLRPLKLPEPSGPIFANSAVPLRLLGSEGLLGALLRRQPALGPPLVRAGQLTRPRLPAGLQKAAASLGRVLELALRPGTATDGPERRGAPPPAPRCRCPGGGVLKEALGLLPLAAALGYSASTAASAAAQAARGGSASAASTPVVTVIPGGGITTTESNTPSVTNSGTDTVTTSALATSTNANNNDLTSNNNDLITNNNSPGAGR
ncbi:hypothetical protein FJT64_011501 [Amphibalanus amphitrite]|uniref:Uncharacterized protein n=1 Tax=Amphibalanus amphitrite TaxID=1232801 RepID=A0A6A4V1X5_AMPAM|nr:hypothetical protein FJT64_011501 [Amphibalanus amphitrite]